MKEKQRETGETNTDELISSCEDFCKKAADDTLKGQGVAPEIRRDSHGLFYCTLGQQNCYMLLVTRVAHTRRTPETVIDLPEFLKKYKGPDWSDPNYSEG